MASSDEIEALSDDMGSLGDGIAEVSAMTEAFRSQLAATRSTLGDTTRDLGNLESGFSRGLRRAFDGVVLDGMRLSDALKGLARSMVDTVYGAAMKPVTDHVGSLLAGGVNSMVSGLMPFADGAPFSQGRVMPFAMGGIVSQATAFPMRGGTGLMGEAGPEAIMPLSRGPDGKLGVAASGGRAVTVTMNITTPDVAGFQRSQGQIAAQMARIMGQGARNR